MTKIEFVSCHKLPERSFFLKGKQFPVCSRCTGIYVGYFIFIPLFWYINVNFFLCLLAIVPTVVDGLTQAYYNRESTNFIRFFTGLIAGFGLSGISDYIAYGIVTLSKIIISTFN
ncbi:DUF2085 domain-containing protein [Flavobacterium sp. SUN052]|uniref:DUF2085 domain-containing protein n=1 Tax=Flavobacterium sp. SUN052 TaxID=3002441 RepID=UPI00237D47BA|nr:DUF2085 domain-containing protein [Flavobacterium sp. SUN052]MEC4004173.1 DUF2085 domain-containing protein [Flavobacterium sp. SUN052]